MNAKPTGLPPATIINEQTDKLREGGALLESALRKAGVNLTRTVYNGVAHELFGITAEVKRGVEAQTRGNQVLCDGLQSKAVAEL